MPFTFRAPVLADAEMLLDWRTRPEITRYMFTDLEPDLARQRQWLRACEARSDFVHFIVEWRGRPIGYLSFAEIDRQHRRCTPGTYLVLAQKERYIAAFTHGFVLDYAFYRLGMHKVCYAIMAGNENFIRAKPLHGVRSVGVQREHIFKYGVFHDVHLFEITEPEWSGQRHLFSRDKTLAAFSAVSADRPIIAISQARMNSTRLPAKVLRPILGHPLLWWHLTRLQRARRLDGLVVATTEAPGSDQIAEIAAGLGIPVHRGSEHDVLARFAGAAERSGAATIVRVTSDCPLIDPALVDRVIDAYLAHRPATQYTSLDVDSFPRGLDAEVFSRAALDAALRESSDPFEHEHVTPFIWRRQERFGFRQLTTAPSAQYRFCVDEAADLALVTRIIETLAPKQPEFGWRDCVALLDADPELAALNAHIRQRAAK